MRRTDGHVARRRLEPSSDKDDGLCAASAAEKPADVK